jgi:two-component system, response regulator PdtaR
VRPHRATDVGDRHILAHSTTQRPLILIVEDEFLIRIHAAQVIRDAGFEVAEAADADEAIAILESRPDIRVVFTDLQMPGSMDGLKLARAVRDRWPPVHIVATSGHRAIREGDLPTGSVFFPKPYSPEKVAATFLTLVAS